MYILMEFVTGQVKICNKKHLCKFFVINNFLPSKKCFIFYYEIKLSLSELTLTIHCAESSWPIDSNFFNGNANLTVALLENQRGESQARRLLHKQRESAGMQPPEQLCAAHCRVRNRRGASREFWVRSKLKRKASDRPTECNIASQALVSSASGFFSECLNGAICRAIGNFRVPRKQLP